MSDSIQIGDVVSVHFHGAQMTLSHSCKVKYKPCAPGDCWVFVDCNNGKTHYVSEGCTISKDKD